MRAGGSRSQASSTAGSGGRPGRRLRGQAGPWTHPSQLCRSKSTDTSSSSENGEESSCGEEEQEEQDEQMGAEEEDKKEICIQVEEREERGECLAAGEAGQG